MGKIKMTAEPGKHEIIMTRDFDAPRELVFKAMTDPTLVPRWWGRTYTRTVVDYMDPKPGGGWRFVEHDTDGSEYAFHGVYHDITAPERVVQTMEFEGMPGHVGLETMILEEHDGKTTVTTSSIFQSVEDRDGILQTDMETGSNESWDQLEDVIKSLM